MELKFRTLRADEIDVRIGGGNTLLLYKDARCDMDLLDETVGPMNWKRSHTRDNANCIVSIWDDDKREWVSKEDTGTESNTEAEKGLASDSFKRACVNWGIGRELYTGPKVKANGGKYDRYICTRIGYDAQRNINDLQIVNESLNTIVFDMKAPKQAAANPSAQSPSAERKEEELDLSNVKTLSPERIKFMRDVMGHCGMEGSADMNAARKALAASKRIANKKFTDMDDSEFLSAMNAIMLEYGKDVKQ